MKKKRNQNSLAYKVLIFKDGLQYGAMGPYLGSSAEKDARADAKGFLAGRGRETPFTAQVVKTRWNGSQQLGLLGAEYSQTDIAFPYYTPLWFDTQIQKWHPYKSVHSVYSASGQKLRNDVIRFADYMDAVEFLESKGARSHMEGTGKAYKIHLITRGSPPLVAWSSNKTVHPEASEDALSNAIAYEKSQQAIRSRSTAKKKGTWSQKYNPSSQTFAELSPGDKSFMNRYADAMGRTTENLMERGIAPTILATRDTWLAVKSDRPPDHRSFWLYWDSLYGDSDVDEPRGGIEGAVAKVLGLRPRNNNPSELGGPRRFQGHKYDYDEFFVDKRTAIANANHIKDQEGHASRVLKVKGGYAVYKGPEFTGTHRGLLPKKAGQTPRRRNPHLVPGELAKVSHQYMEWLERFGHNYYTPPELDALRMTAPYTILEVIEQIPGGYLVYDENPLKGHSIHQTYADESLVSAESITDVWPGTNYKGKEPPEADLRAAGAIFNPSYPEYGFYVVHKPSGKVLSGWEYREDAKDSLDEFLDSGVPSSHVSVMTSRGVKGRFGGIEWVEGPLKNPDVGQLVYWKGDLGRFTGKNEWMNGAEFWEVEMLEGHRRGQVVWTVVEGIGRVFPLNNPDWKALKEKAMQLAESAASAGKAGAARIKEEAELVGAKARIAKVQSEIAKLEQCAKALGNVHSPKLPEGYEIEDGRLTPGITEYNLMGGLNPGPKEGYEGLFEKREQLIDAKDSLRQIESEVSSARKARA